MTKNEIRNLRSWAYDCAVSDDEEQMMVESSDDSIVRWAKRNYQGDIADLIEGPENVQFNKIQIKGYLKA